MTQPNYFQGNSFLAPYTYPVNIGFSNVMQYQNVQPYFFLSHCAKLQGKVEEMFNLVDANSDGKVTLAEMQTTHWIQTLGWRQYGMTFFQTWEVTNFKRK